MRAGPTDPVGRDDQQPKGGAVPDVLVEIPCGKLRGGRSARAPRVLEFRGIPYAAPPTGVHRWQPPQPLEPWPGVREAVEFGPSCPQPPDRPASWAPEPSENEDCLYLNVWTPGIADGARRPVMVWLHGGGYAIGSGSWAVYDGAKLADRGDVVVVTVNHRLGVLGYLDLEGVAGAGGEYASSANSGMLDLVAVLEWVRDNISCFGGDAGNVTIFGESGGGAKVSTLHVMPAARGLFHRAVVQSGPGLRLLTPEQSHESTEGLLSHLGIEPNNDVMARLLRLSADELVAAQRELWPRPAARSGRAAAADGERPLGALGGFAPILDGVTTTAHPGAALGRGTAADVPLLIGRNKDEGTLFMAADPVLADPDSLDEAGLSRRLSAFGSRSSELLEAYRGIYPNATRLDLLIALRSDSFMGLGTALLAEQKVRGTSTPTYMYRFEWGAGMLRSAHGFEIAFVFDNADEPVMRPGPRRAVLAERMSEAWIAFARHGDPNHDKLSYWPAYESDDKATMIFDQGDCHAERDPFEQVHHLWRQPA